MLARQVIKMNGNCVITVHTVTIVSGGLENDLRNMRIVREEVSQH